MEETFSIGSRVPLESRSESYDHARVASGNIDNTLVESIWHELNGRVDREYIDQAILEANSRYQNAVIKTFVPIFIRRYVLNKLRTEYNFKNNL